MTPRAIHYGEAASLWIQRQRALELAYAAHPERFVKGTPQPPALPSAVWINPPKAARASAVVAGAWTLWTTRSVAESCPQVHTPTRKELCLPNQPCASTLNSRVSCLKRVDTFRGDG